jgi:AbrB family looped-hinge helix DNA binding protein
VEVMIVTGVLISIARLAFKGGSGLLDLLMKIPREVRKKLGVKGGEKLLVLTRDGDILLRKTENESIEEIVKKIQKVISKEAIDVDALVAEAVEWARKSKQSSTQTFGCQSLCRRFLRKSFRRQNKN